MVVLWLCFNRRWVRGVEVVGSYLVLAEILSFSSRDLTEAVSLIYSDMYRLDISMLKT